MRFGLVSPPTVTEFNRDLAESEAILRLAEHAPLGILTLASVLEERGRPPAILDLNAFYYEYLRSDNSTGAVSSFADYAVERLLAADLDTVGFGTICSSYPLTLRIAEGLRRARPHTRIILGGPQASVVDHATVEAFPFVDYIVRFEAEESLPQLLDALERDGDVSAVPGMTWRRDGEVVRTQNAPVIADLDRLPLPAYHLYPYLREASYIPLELGRGCPYGCTFCSTNDFFRRTFRLKTPRLIVEQMSALKAQYDIAVFDLIHDMFTVDRAKVMDFCDELRASDEKLYWNCSARTDRVDDELMAAMAEAGCRGIFFGIETGSQTLQKKIKKNLVLPDAMKRIRAASDNDLQVAVSLITGFPDETWQDFRDTVDFFANSLRYENAVPQLHIVAPLADTPIHREYRDRLTFDDIISDMSHQGWEQDPEDRELIARHPDIFANFYAVPTPLDRELLKEVRGFLLTSFRRFRWLVVALHQEEGHILDVFSDFATWRQGLGERPEASADDRTPYYQGRQFREDFVAYVRACSLPRARNPGALEALLSYATSFDDVMVDDPTIDVPGPDEVKDGKMLRRALGPGSVPRVAEGVTILEVDVDYESMMDCLVEGNGLDNVPAVSQKLASRKLPGRWPEVLSLSPLSASVLELCDGVRTVAEIGEGLPELPPTLAGIPTDKVGLIGLEMLRHDGLIEDSRPGA